MKREYGFTLVELVMALAVLAIVITIGIPAFNNFVQNQRTTSQVNEVIGVLQLARNEALARGQRVGLWSVDGDWNSGYQMKLDSNNDGDYDDAGDEVLFEFAATQFATLTVDADPMDFLPSGFLPQAYLLNILADGCKNQNNRDITISRSGAISVERKDC